MSSLSQGTRVIAEAAAQLPLTPGVYQMINGKGDVLYVGKARFLKKRVTSYTRPHTLSLRLQHMIAETCRVDIIVTHTESEALLLESNLIKQLMPPYNILLRDDKSFAFLKLTFHPFPLLTKHRGRLDPEATHFGPFASTQAVNGTLETLYRVFQLRSCSDTMFQNRKRPCLQYHIKRCSAPCVQKVSQESYSQQVQDALAFLGNKSQSLIHQLSARMQQASDDLDFEQAARLRDQIQCLSHIQQQQGIHIHGLQDADVVALHREGGQTCIQVFFFRNGCNYGNRPYFPRHHKDDSIEHILSAFLMQFYQDHPAPSLVLLSHTPVDRPLIEEALNNLHHNKVCLMTPKKGIRRKIVDQAMVNAREALARKFSEKASHQKDLVMLQDLFQLPTCPQRVEIYDNSHLFGKDAYGAMVVYGADGFLKKEYRKYKITTPQKSTGGDDYAMMREVFTRRFRGHENATSPHHLPDIILIDGGEGQRSQAQAVLEELALSNILVVGIAKGPERHAGQERLFLAKRLPLILETTHPTLYLLQRLRDEAHRFAIEAHRHRRIRNLEHSLLDDVPGIGAKRKKALLHHFGSAYNVKRAGKEDLQKVTGISASLATMVYDFFHPTR